MKVLVTRPLAQMESFSNALHQVGFEPISFPVIEIHPAPDLGVLEQALSNIQRYDWVVFTSANAVDVVFDHLKSRRENPQLLFRNVKIAAIGPITAQSLSERDIAVTYVPTEFVAEAILPGLGDLSGKWVLLPRAEIARKALPEAINAAGGYAHEVTVYHTLPVEPAPDGLAALRSGVDWITFTSPSTVQNFVRILRSSGLDPLDLPGKPRIACIGPITEQAARLAGFAVDVVADTYTTEGLIHAISIGSNLSSGKSHLE
jgi:uroporphyrinogen III methyltransferase/synthase